VAESGRRGDQGQVVGFLSARLRQHTPKSWSHSQRPHFPVTSGLEGAHSLAESSPFPTTPLDQGYSKPLWKNVSRVPNVCYLPRAYIRRPGLRWCSFLSVATSKVASFRSLPSNQTHVASPEELSTVVMVIFGPTLFNSTISPGWKSSILSASFVVVSICISCRHAPAISLPHGFILKEIN